MDFSPEPTTAGPGEGIHGASRAFVLLETARLRAEALVERFGDNDQFWAIQGEIGLAGFTTCADFDPAHRHTCTALAMEKLTEDPRGPGLGVNVSATLATMFSETIAASDALARELADRDVDGSRRDRLHEVHTHVMSACELLDERLTVLELESAGAGAGAERR